MRAILSLEKYLDNLDNEDLRMALKSFQQEQGAFESITVASENDETIELIVTGLSDDEDWNGGAVQYFLNKKTLQTTQGWQEDTSPVCQDDSDVGTIKMIEGISVNLHFAGIRLMNSAKNTLVKQRHFLVLLNDELVYKFSVRPANDEKLTLRVKMADYKKIDLDGVGQYKLVVFEQASSNKTKRILTIERPLWIHFSYVIYPDNQQPAESDGITIDVFETPQIYR